MNKLLIISDKNSKSLNIKKQIKKIFKRQPLKRGKAEGREKFPRRNKSGVLYKYLITTKITCPRGEIGRHKGLKILALLGVPVRVWPRAPL